MNPLIYGISRVVFSCSVYEHNCDTADTTAVIHHEMIFCLYNYLCVLIMNKGKCVRLRYGPRSQIFKL